MIAFVMRYQIKKELSVPFTAPESFLSFIFDKVLFGCYDLSDNTF